MPSAPQGSCAAQGTRSAGPSNPTGPGLPSAEAVRALGGFKMTLPVTPQSLFLSCSLDGMTDRAPWRKTGPQAEPIHQAFL